MSEKLLGTSTPKTGPKQTTPEIKFWALFPLMGHVALVGLTMIFVLWYVDGNSFGLTERGTFRAIGQTEFSWRDYTPLQSDINTILSALTTCSRSLAVITMTDIFLKSVLVLLEKSGLTARQISRMVMFGNVPFGKYTRKGRGHQYVWAVGIALALPFPAQFSSPLLSGAIAWLPSHKLAIGSSLKDIAKFTPDSLMWKAYEYEPGYRHMVAVDAARMSGVAWGSHASNHSNIKRDLPSAATRQDKFTNASVIHNLTVPYISLSNLQWVTDLNTIPTLQLEAVDPVANSSLITSMTTVHPLYSFPQQGKVVLIPPKPWKQQNATSTVTIGTTTAPDYVAPPDQTFHETMYIAALAVLFLGDNPTPCDASASLDFYGTLPPNAAFYEQRLTDAWRPSGGRACILFAAVDVVAGVTECSNCELEGGRTAVLDPNRGSKFTPDADTLVNEALHLTSDTSATMAEWNISVPMAWNNIDAYVKTTLERAYVASWQSLTEFVGKTAPANSKLHSRVDLAAPALEADVKHWRVWTWFCLQILVWASAFIFYMAQFRCSRPMSGETFLSVLFLDATSLGSGVSEYTELSPDIHDKWGRLDLIEVDPGNHDTAWELQPSNPPLGTKTSTSSELGIPTLSYKS